MDILNTVVISLMRNSTAGTEFREVNQKARFNPILEAEVARFRAHGLIINRASTPVSCVRDLYVCGPWWNRSTNTGLGCHSVPRYPCFHHSRGDS